MTRIRIVLAGLLATLPGWGYQAHDPCAASSSASDIRFELRLQDHGPTFQSGEIVPLALTFTASADRPYTINTNRPDRRSLGNDLYCLDPAGVDPLASYFRTGPFSGGGLVATAVLDAKPVVFEAELNEWWSLRPGHYRLFVMSQRVSLGGEAPARGMLTLRSNAVEFDVLPPDPDWQATQLRTAVVTLTGPATLAEQKRAARVLRFLNTESSTRELAHFFNGLSEREPTGWDLIFGLYGSPYRQLTIDAMFAQLKAPDHAVPYEFLRALVNLQLTADRSWDLPLGLPDPEGAAFFARRRAHSDELLKAELQSVAGALPQKQGVARAVTLGALLTGGAETGALPQGVRPALLAEWENLPGDVQRNLIQYRWPLIEGAEMVPILRKMLAEPPPADANVRTVLSIARDAALRRLFELDPAAGREAILTDLRNEKAQPGLGAIALLPKEDRESAVPPALRRIEENRARQLDYDLVDRYAGEEALPVVQGLIESHEGNWNCPMQAALLRYLLRASPDKGAAEVDSALADRRASSCYRFLLVDLGDAVAYAPSVAVAALNDGEDQVAQSAADALGRWGSKEAETALWERLRKFHAEWAGRQSELQGHVGLPNAISHAISLEYYLVTAIAKGTNWICPPEKLDRLAEVVWTHGALQLIAGWKSNWNQSPIVITSNWFPEETPTFSVLQYDRLSEEQLLGKLAQLPGKELRWRFWKTGEISPSVSQERQEKVFNLVRSELASYGRTLGKLLP
jgi:hypothetical protein